ncbi:MAG TPA: type II secretion system F family protein [Gemmatimonadales bacterium]|nr:type II secretion system F family protein [Gemmatimonadales bacterium]
MLILVLILVALSAACVVLFLGEVVPGRQGALSRRLAELEASREGTPEILKRRRRQLQAERLAGVIEALGTRAEASYQNLSALRLRLIQAGYPNPSAVPLFLGTRIVLPVVLGFGGMFLVFAAGYGMMMASLVTVWGLGFGYVAPTFHVSMRRAKRMKEMQKALPDALDMLVVCVEAGLGLNQAMVRVSEEIERISRVLSEQLSLVNLEIRAGTAREEALRNLGERTGLDDLKSLVAMLIQTDRFGTSIATALRVQADTLRTKRRQRAEEAAAKTTIKLVFPLVLFIFPAMFVVILGPALITIMDALSNFRQ